MMHRLTPTPLYGWMDTYTHTHKERHICGHSWLVFTSREGKNIYAQVHIHG